MSGAVLAIAGIALSAGLWLTGVRLMLTVQAEAIDDMPSAWRARAPEDYEALRLLRVGDLARDPYRLLALLAATVGFFWLLTVAGVSAGVQAGFGTVAAVYWTSASVVDARREREAYRAVHDLNAVPRNRPLAWRYRVALFMTCFGFVMLAFFIPQGVS